MNPSTVTYIWQHLPHPWLMAKIHANSITLMKEKTYRIAFLRVNYMPFLVEVIVQKKHTMLTFTKYSLFDLWNQRRITYGCMLPVLELVSSQMHKFYEH